MYFKGLHIDFIIQQIRCMNTETNSCKSEQAHREEGNEMVDKGAIGGRTTHFILFCCKFIHVKVSTFNMKHSQADELLLGLDH